MFFHYSSDSLYFEGNFPEKKLNFSLLAGGPVSPEQAEEYVKVILKQKLGITIAKEKRVLPVLLLNVTDPERLKREESNTDFASAEEKKFIPPFRIKRTLDDLALSLSRSFSKRIINNTGLTDKYLVIFPYHTFNKTQKYLRNRYGIYFTEAQREVTVYCISCKKNNIPKNSSHPVFIIFI